MLKNKRHLEILEVLKQDSFVSVRELSVRLYASQPTIRRDLIFLEQQGYIRRSHGGAVLADGKNHTPLNFRKETKPKEKMQICQVAATLIQPESLIFVDASTTASYLSDWIKEGDRVSVVTNGLSLCHTLSKKHIPVFSTGGRVLKDSEAFVGRIAEENLSRFNGDWMFFSSSALSEDGMVSDYCEEETSLMQAMHRHSQRHVLLIEAGKFGNRSPFHRFSLDEIDYIVTNMALPEELLRRYRFSLIRQMLPVRLYEKKKN